MIVQTYPSLRPSPAPLVYNLASYTKIDYTKAKQLADARKISVAEWWRRNTIVENLYKTCKDLQLYSSYLPKDKDARNKYGWCCVRQIFADYTEVPLVEPWPDDDKPYPLTVAADNHREGLLLCTADWLDTSTQKKVVHEC